MKINLQECVVFGSDGFADAEATAAAVREALRAAVATERETDVQIGATVEKVFNLFPAKRIPEMTLVQGVIGMMVPGFDPERQAEIANAFNGWKARNVVDHKDPFAGSARYTNKKGPGGGIGRQ